MCCQSCDRFSTCQSVVTLRIHGPAAHGLPPDHFHLCRTRSICEYRCDSCGKSVGAWGSVPKTMFFYGCCRRCSDYVTCKDFVAPHLEEAKTLQTASAAKARLWQQSAAVETRTRRRTPALPR